MTKMIDTYAKALPWLLLIFVGLYFFELASFPFSIDEEIGAFRTDASLWITQGRWGAYLIEAFLLPQPSIPVVAPAIFGVAAALAYVLILDVSRPRQSLQMTDYLTFAIFVGYPVWFFIVEFYANIAGTGLGLLLAALAVWMLYSEESSLRPRIRFAMAVLAATLAVATYQSFLLVLVAMFAGVIALRLVSGHSKRGWHETGLAMALVVCSAILYLGVDKLARMFRPGQSAYFDSLWRFDLLLESPGLVLQRSGWSIANAYGVLSADFGAPLWGAAIVIFVGAVALAVSALKLSNSHRILLLGSGITALIAPFGLQFVSGGLLPYRAFVGTPFVVWFFAALALSTPWPKFNLVAGAAICLLVFQSFVLGNLYQASHYFTSRSDLLLASSISQSIAGLPEFDPDKTYVLSLYGSRPFVGAAYPQPRTSTIGRSFFEWDGGNANRISYYMRLLGYPGFRAPSPEIETQTIEQLAQMPVYPASGSIQIEGGVILLRLNAQPRWRNMQAMERAEAE